MNIAALLRQLRERAGMSQAEVARALGVGRSTYVKYETGASPPTRKLYEISKLFKIPIDRLVGEESPRVFTAQDFTSLPVIGEIRAGFPALAQENIIGYEQIPMAWLGSGEYFVLVVKGDSMVDARICDGDHVIVRLQPTCENGEIAVVSIDGIETEATLKRVFFDGDKVELVPENRAYPRRSYPASQVLIRGVVKTVVFHL